MVATLGVEPRTLPASTGRSTNWAKSPYGWIAGGRTQNRRINSAVLYHWATIHYGVTEEDWTPIFRTTTWRDNHFTTVNICFSYHYDTILASTTGIEPVILPWQGSVLTAILYGHIGEVGRTRTFAFGFTDRRATFALQLIWSRWVELNHRLRYPRPPCYRYTTPRYIKSPSDGGLQ